VVQLRTCFLQVNLTGLSNGCSEGAGFLPAAVTVAAPARISIAKRAMSTGIVSRGSGDICYRCAGVIDVLVRKRTTGTMAVRNIR